MYRVDRNNFYKNEKKATVFTPSFVSDFLFSLLKDVVKPEQGVILDPCVGAGSLLYPFVNAGYKTLGIDIEDQGFPNTLVKSFLKTTQEEVQNISLVIMNPPFNIDEKTKTEIKKLYASRPLLPEVWLRRTIELTGRDIPIVMFTPYGFRLNQTMSSKRWQSFANKEYPTITGIISLPKDVFEGVLFHSEILLFNLPMLKGHYFCNGNL